MMEFLSLDSDNLQWFAPLMPQQLPQRILRDEATMGVGVIMDDVACGTAVVVVTENMVELVYLMVAPQYRRKGVATGLIDWLCTLCGKTIMPLVGYLPVENPDTDGLLRFFLDRSDFAIGQDPNETKMYTVSVGAITGLPAQVGDNPLTPVVFDSLTVDQRENFYDLMDGEGFEFVRTYGERPKLTVPYLNLCFVEESDVVAAVFYEPYGEGDVRLSFFYGREDARRQQAAVLVESLKRLVDSAYRNGTLHLAPMTEGEQWLIERLLPQKKESGLVYVISQDLAEWEEE